MRSNNHHLSSNKEVTMPYVNIQITRDGVTQEQKAALIRGATDLLVRVLAKNPATTFVVIDEVETDNWGIAGETVTMLRQNEIEITVAKKGKQ
jgi:4-oxalocrotonate tautomerase